MKTYYVPWTTWFDTPPFYQKHEIADVLLMTDAKNIHYERKYGWSNQPQVVVFKTKNPEAIRETLNKHFKTIWISVDKKNWRQREGR